MKAHAIVLSELATTDILEQAEWYEAQADPKLAARWERAVTSTLLRISRLLNSGAPCNFRAPELQGARRVVVSGFPKHLVFYRVSVEGIVVLRVVHGARDIESLFSA